MVPPITQIMKIQLKHYISRLRFNLEKFNDMCSVKGARPLINILKSLLIIGGLRVTSGKIKTIVFLCRTINKFYRANGPKGTTLYLKACSVSLQQALGGYIVADPANIAGPRLSRNRKGFPRLISIQHRVELRNGASDIARFYLTFFNLYRNIVYLGTPGLATITEPDFGTHTLDNVLEDMIPNFMQLFVFDRIAREDVLKYMRKEAGYMAPIFKSSPGGFLLTGNTEGSVEKFSFSSHPAVLVRTAVALGNQPKLAKSLFAILGFTADTNISKAFLSVIKTGIGATLSPIRSLGKLGAKVESAGKVRIFAMVDAWTQWALNPIHKVIFHILKGITMDGTFDQMAPLYRADSFPELHSLDLSAATDRLPLRLQVQLLAELLGDREIALHWANLLVGRSYAFRVKGFERFHGVYKYAVGQPMGALSSWAMLALTHHFIVQASAWLAGLPRGTLYRNYAVLGDDLVIGDAIVKDAYLEILRSLGVKVGIHKSLLSPKGEALEFAKRTIWRGVDVSPIPLKEFNAACQTVPNMTSFSNKYEMDLVTTVRAFGFGFRTITGLASKPLGKMGSNVRLIILGMSLPDNAASAEEFFRMGEPRLVRHRINLAEILQKFNLVELGRVRSQIAKYYEQLSKVNPAT
jgi:hypothetical protein